MRNCPRCGHLNQVGVLFCEECGSQVSTGASATLPTRTMTADSDQLYQPAPAWESRELQGDEILLQVEDSKQPIKVQSRKQVSLGRYDVSNQSQPDIDLTPYSALEKGVSRLHAIMEFDESTVTLKDAGSSNGTFINGTRLSDEQVHILKDGDELRFGKLVSHIYFK
ncbi:FHA domain-containing protein [Anaerolineales bacterium]